MVYHTMLSYVCIDLYMIYCVILVQACFDSYEY